MNKRTFRVRCLWLSPSVSYSPGELRIEDGRVRGLGPARSGRVAPIAIFPGLVNAHTHLQLPALARPRREFLPWVNAVMALRGATTDTDRTATARAALKSLILDGVTSVGEIDSTGLSPQVLRETSMAGLCYQELVGFDLKGRAATAAVAQGLVAGSARCRSGLSPHAPYSVSRSLLKASHATGRPLSVHVAETPEEVRFLRDGKGPFRELLEGLGKIPAGFRAPGLSPVQWLDRAKVLGPRTSLIHAQHIEKEDVATIARRGSPIVVCPGTIRYFRRRPPPVPTWLDLGIPVALGTDSLSSNTELSMRAEMAQARSMWPELSPAVVLAMATLHGQRALCGQGSPGLRRGGAASFVAVPCEGDTHECMEAFTANERQPAQIWFQGQRIL